RSLPSKYDTTRPGTVTPRSRASRASRRVSSAATTSALLSASASRGEASPELPSGAPSNTSRPVPMLPIQSLPWLLRLARCRGSSERSLRSRGDFGGDRGAGRRAGGVGTGDDPAPAAATGTFGWAFVLVRHRAGGAHRGRAAAGRALASGRQDVRRDLLRDRGGRAAAPRRGVAD